MYLVSVYFDKNTNKMIQNHMEEIAKITGNDFMTRNHVPPHMTIAAMDAKRIEDILPKMEGLKDSLCAIDVYFVSVGAFFPYVLYVAPVMDYPLQELQKVVFTQLKDVPFVRMNKYYQPGYWLAHATLAKKLNLEEMREAFHYCQNHFSPIKGRIVKIGLSTVNPHKAVWILELE
ncbi:MAG: 2'-5' RNA ligase family protein [Bacillota bacterium]|nr:2'-5' RNA ligase family protein [Bacillota bacterium]